MKQDKKKTPEQSVFEEDHTAPVSLDEYLRKLIAARDRITAEEVTVEYIRQERQRRFYPTAIYGTAVTGGRHDALGLTCHSQEELTYIRLQSDHWLEKPCLWN